MTLTQAQKRVNQLAKERNKKPEIQEAKREKYQRESTNIWYEKIQRRFGITQEQYEAILKKQDGLCAICSKPQGSGTNQDKRLAVDHDHKTGKIRGLLCTNCNPGLGFFKDDIVFLKRAIEYLERQ